MKDKQKVIAALNEALRLEHAATLQYQQQSLLVRGLSRVTFQEFFAGKSLEAHGHAEKFGRKIVALGGFPTVEVGAVRDTLDLREMFQLDLELERAALANYAEARTWAEGDVPLVSMLEEQMGMEQSDVEELELILDQVRTVS